MTALNAVVPLLLVEVPPDIVPLPAVRTVDEYLPSSSAHSSFRGTVAKDCCSCGAKTHTASCCVRA